MMSTLASAETAKDRPRGAQDDAIIDALNTIADSIGSIGGAEDISDGMVVALRNSIQGHSTLNDINCVRIPTVTNNFETTIDRTSSQINAPGQHSNEPFPSLHAAAKALFDIIHKAECQDEFSILTFTHTGAFPKRGKVVDESRNELSEEIEEIHFFRRYPHDAYVLKHDGKVANQTAHDIRNKFLKKCSDVLIKKGIVTTIHEKIGPLNSTTDQFYSHDLVKIDASTRNWDKTVVLRRTNYLPL